MQDCLRFLSFLMEHAPKRDILNGRIALIYPAKKIPLVAVPFKRYHINDVSFKPFKCLKWLAQNGYVEFYFTDRKRKVFIVLTEKSKKLLNVSDLEHAKP